MQCEQGISRRELLGGAVALAIPVLVPLGGLARSGAIAVPAGAATGALEPTLQALLADIRHGDRAVRGAAVAAAPLVGTPAVVPLGALLCDGDPAAAGSAREALRRVVRHAGRPGAPQEARAAEAGLRVLSGAGVPARIREEARALLSVVERSRAAALPAAWRG